MIVVCVTDHEEMTKNPRMVFFFEEVKELTEKYIGFENLPDDETLLKVVGKVSADSIVCVYNTLFIYAFFVVAFNEICLHLTCCDFLANKQTNISIN